MMVKKNNICINNLKYKTKFSSVFYIPSIQFNNKSLCFTIETRNFHLNNIRAINRKCPHNNEVLSVIIGSLLGDAYANRRSG